MNEVATFVDKYGDERTIHRTRHGLKVKNEHKTPILQMNQAIASLIGPRIKALRQERGWTLVELADRIGIKSGHPKNRIWEIENSVRREGMRLGTLYALALAFDVEIEELMPSVEEVARAARVQNVFVPTVRNGS
jgi:DNA-binding XRE family transcriptional regulator